jgi:periplasmic divalent cation tolerance protein
MVKAKPDYGHRLGLRLAGSGLDGGSKRVGAITLRLSGGKLRNPGMCHFVQLPRLGSMAEYLQVSTATPTRDDAVRLAGSAVSAGLAAGAQIVGPVISVFWHNDTYGEGEEWQVLLKTSIDRYADLEAHLLAEHPWGNPELGAVPIVKGSQGYFDWLEKFTTKR